MEFKSISIENKNLFDKYFAAKEYDVSEYTFSNLFMWRNAYDIKFAEVNECLLISAMTTDGLPFYLMPSGNKDISEVLDCLLSGWKNHKIPIFRSLSNQMIYELEKIRPGLFEYKPEISSFEYVYESKDLIFLEGKKFHAKRNHINKFKSLYQYEYISYSETLKEACLVFFKKWYDAALISNEDTLYLRNEERAIYELFDNFEALKVQGGVILVDNEVVAFTFGEKLTKDMYLIHIEKADKDFSGSYAMINSMFSEANCKNFEYINREEDLGIEGLRKSKMSYHPVKKVEKFSAFIK